MLIMNTVLSSGLLIEVRLHDLKNNFLFLNQNICYGYSKELSHRDSSFELSHRDSSFEHPKEMFILFDKKIITFLNPFFFSFLMFC